MSMQYALFQIQMTTKDNALHTCTHYSTSQSLANPSYGINLIGITEKGQEILPVSLWIVNKTLVEILTIP